MGRFFFLLSACLAVVGCESTDAPPGASDAGVQCSIGSPFEQGDLVGAPDPLASKAGEARAGVLAADAVPVDRTGLGTYKAGNFVLANSKVALLIEQAGPSSRYDPWGGKPVGLARVRDSKLIEAADFDELFFAIGRHTVETTSVTITKDGRAGGSASIRAIGTLRPLPFIAEFGKLLAPQDYENVQVALDYELAPDAEHVDVSMTFDVGPETMVVESPLFGFFQSYRMPRFLPDYGFAEKLATGARFSWVGFSDDEATSYAIEAASSTIVPFISVIGFDTFKADRYELPACSRTRRPIARMIIGGPGVDGLQEATARLAGTKLRTITGRVDVPVGSRVRVHSTTKDGARYLTRTFAANDGSYTLHVPSDLDVSLTAYVAGTAISPKVDVPKGATDAPKIALPPAGAVHVVAKSTTGEPLPVRVQVIAGEGTAPAAPASFGERRPAGDQLWVVFPKDGDVSLRVPPGKHRVIVSRGYEYDIVDRTVDVSADATVTIDATLTRVVDSAGLLCGDFHVHSHRSPDSPDDVKLTVAALAGEGLDVAARTEHEFIADFEPTIAELGLGKHLFGVGSLELTTFEWGHFNVLPLVPDPTKPNAGAFGWAGKKPPQVFSEVRASASKPTIIINHPRGATSGSYFVASLLNQTTGLPGEESMWDEGWQVVEVFNGATGADFETNRTASVRDWFALLRRGKKTFAVAGSDAHYVDGKGPLGYPRACLALGDDPRKLTGNLVRDALDAGKSTISGGILVTSKVGAVTEGGEATGVGSKTKVRVRVQAPAWVTVDGLEILVDGKATQKIVIDDGTRDPTNPVVRFDRDVDVDVAEGKGSFFIAVATGSKDLAPVHPGMKAFGVTNPIFLRR